MNKEQLESMSEGELSAEVLRSIALKNDGYVVAGVRHNGSMALANVKVGKVMTGISFDINNWSDMGPLIEKIWDDLFENTGYEGQKLWDDLVSDGNKPTRAAAIVYLLMQGGE